MADDAWAVEQLTAFVGYVDERAEIQSTLHVLGSDREDVQSQHQRIDEVEAKITKAQTSHTDNHGRRRSAC